MFDLRTTPIIFFHGADGQVFFQPSQKSKIILNSFNHYTYDYELRYVLLFEKIALVLMWESNVALSSPPGTKFFIYFIFMNHKSYDDAYHLDESSSRYLHNVCKSTLIIFYSSKKCRKFDLLFFFFNNSTRF